MKIFVMSDIHGSVENLKSIAHRVNIERPDKIVVCGDIFGWGEQQKLEVANILKSFSQTVYLIKGNNDSVYDEELLGKTMRDSVIMYHFGRNLFFTHGHMYNLSHIPPILNVGDVFVYGHSHVGGLSKVSGLNVVNVPALSRPRGGSAKGYIILDENGATLKDLDGNELDSRQFV